MRLLVDTCVVSEVRRSRGEPRVRAALQAIDDANLFLSVVTIGELVRGVRVLRDEDRRSALETWLHELETRFANRILPIDVTVARIWGELDAAARSRGVTIPVADGLIAATALRHELTLMTRNVAHFEPTGVRIVDPWV